MKNSILLAIALIISSQSFAQEKNCGNYSFTQDFRAGHPELKPGKTPTSRAKDNSRKIIPIVFHILQEYGTENISDLQVYDAVEVLNQHYNMTNPNLAQIDSSFHNNIAYCDIEFRLAATDPNGNCTNGIEHIFTSETNLADDHSKINQWPRDKYLNIWVVKTISDQGVSGYTYTPQIVNYSETAHLDGIIILHQYIGSIGTASVLTSRSLTHEIAHWLGIQHTWGEGEAMIACGDDGIADTPETKGGYACSYNSPACNEGIVENIENFMHTIYCTGMFTNGQKDLMHATLESNLSERNNIWQDANLIATGVMNPENTCIPVADFAPDPRLAMTGSTIVFKNHSWNAPVDSYQWSFPGGTPSTSTLQNPSVTYASGGYYDAQLIVTNSAGSDTLILENIVHISNPWGDFFGPVNNTFDDETANWWIIQNAEDENGGFELTPSIGVSGTNCFSLNNFYQGDEIDADNYYNMLGKTNDAIISPSYFLANTSNTVISFQYAGAFLTEDAEKINRAQLSLHSSRDGGKTWTQRKILTGSELQTSNSAVSEKYIPSAAEWQTVSVPYTTSSSDKWTRFKLEYTPADSSNNFYIDNFNVNGILSAGENITEQISISPNPVQSNHPLTISRLTDVEHQIIIKDLKGSEMKTMSTKSDSHTLEIEAAPGCYLVTITSATGQITKKIVVQ